MAKILLVDDVYTARSMTERILRHVGRYEVYSVDSGHEAITAAKANLPDVIILDISMAGMDGLHTLQQLRTLGVVCPVIAYTARTEQSSGEFVSQGFSAYVSKNGNLSGLLTTVRELIGS
ncbi:response regulator [Chloroflexales bacterium ZM16-3]|nr:response regulator [Chloroflexales bacterium ZM16-3]